MRDKGFKRSEENEMRATEGCCGEETTTISTEILKPGRFSSFLGLSSAQRKRHCGGIRAASQCRKKCVVKQTMLWCLKDWAVETGIWFDSPLSLPPTAFLFSQNNGQKKNRNTAYHGQYLLSLQSPSSPFHCLQCPELYLARTKPLCHLFKGLFFPFFIAIFVLMGLAFYIISSSPLSIFYSPTSSVRMVFSRKPMSLAYFAQSMSPLSSLVGFPTIFILMRP